MGRLLSDSNVLTALRLSLECATIATGVSLVVGVPLAWVLARVTIPGISLLRALVTLPLVLPPVVGGLALSGIPPFSGLFSKDEIIALEFDRGGWHIVLGVLAYVGSFLTAIYTFRMIFRAFFGDMSPEAEELSHGHLYHPPEPTNPATGEVEDTDVGFPGPEHHIAEREGSMKVAMGVLAVLATIANSTTNDLPGGAQNPVALTEGFHDAFLVGAGFAALGVVLALVLLRHRELREAQRELAAQSQAATAAA